MTLLSALPEARVLPSGLKATLLHRARVPGERLAQAAGGVATSHRMMVLSPLPEARVLPSGLKATLSHRRRCGP